MASTKAILAKLGLSWHDVFVIILLFETSWWCMFAVMDSADVVLRAINESGRTEYHLFVFVQKCVSFLKLLAVLVCLWLGGVIWGMGVLPRVYLLLGILVDTVLLLSWAVIATEENWPLSPQNIFGAHYAVTFFLLRLVIYYALYCSLSEIFVSPFGPPIVGNVNGTVVGIPDQGNHRTVNSGNNISFLGKGVKAVLQYYRIQSDKAFLIAVIWDTFWNSSIIFSQELPEVAFNYVIVGLFGSLPLNISTDDFILRAVRVVLGLIAIYIVTKRVHLYVMIWIVLYTSVMVINTGLFCYIAASSLIEETTLATIVLCSVFFASNVAKILIIYCALRYYMRLRKDNTSLVSENNNSANHCDEGIFNPAFTGE